MWEKGRWWRVFRWKKHGLAIKLSLESKNYYWWKIKEEILSKAVEQY